MISQAQKKVLMELIQAYGVDESLRGFHIGMANETGEARQERFCELKLIQIENYLNNISSNQAEN
jgi:hypothetical protein